MSASNRDLYNDKYGIAKLTGPDNYPIWSKKMYAILVTKEVGAALEPEKPGVKSRASSESESALDAMSDKAKAIIALCVVDSLVQTVVEAATARAAWESLEKQYKTRSSGSRLTLKRALNTITMLPNESVVDYLNRANGLVENLAAAGHKVPDEDIVLSVVAGLPDDGFGTIKEIFMDKDPLPKMDVVSSKLIMHEARAKAVTAAAAPTTGGNQPTVNPAFAALSTGFKGRCNYCKKVGHMSRDCRKRIAAAKEREEEQRFKGVTALAAF